MKYVLATANPGKVTEMRQILSELDIECVTREQLGINIDVDETGTTFYENAMLKARAICSMSGLPAIADDSGLVVEALGGEPGVFSSSYGGEDLSSKQRCKFLLKNMKKAEQRRAKFVCTIICAFPDGSVLSATGECHGQIVTEPRGSSGFGYDPVFMPDGYTATMAELSSDEKNLISHRGNALREFSKLLKSRCLPRIGIFGGAFNPPHIGHVQAAKKAISENDLDLLIVIPTGIPPHKLLPPDTPDASVRLKMTKNAFCDVPNVIVSDIEVYSTDSNYSIDTVCKLKQKYPKSEFYLLVGTDMYEMLSTWKDSDTLLEMVTPIILSREDVKISSTEIRTMLQNREGSAFVSRDNYSYIIKHRLYKSKPDWDWLRERAYSMLDEIRIPHVEACEAEAVKLAKRWNADIEQAREAAILHDVAKRLDFTENMCIIAENNVAAPDLGEAGEKLLHQITGSLLAKSEFGVSNSVSEAIRWHTTGRPGMSILEKILYIADYIESTRVFPGVEELRQKAYDNIDDAVMTGLELTAGELLLRGIKPSKETTEAIDELKLRLSD